MRPLGKFALDYSTNALFSALFFASIGLRCNLSMLRANYKRVMQFFAVVIMVAFVQNIISLGMAALFNSSKEEALMQGSLVFMGDLSLGKTLSAFSSSADSLLPQFAGIAVLSVLIGTIIGGQIMKRLRHKVDFSMTVVPAGPQIAFPELIKYLFVFSLSAGIGFLPQQFGIGQWINPLGGAFLAGLLVRLIADNLDSRRLITRLAA